MTDDTDRITPEDDTRPTFGLFIAVYMGTMVFGFALSLLTHLLWGLNTERTMFAYVGVLFGLGATRRPELLFQVLRSTGWFALIDNDRFMQILLGAVAVLMMTLSYLIGSPNR